jgi:putative DNA primase/helicase
MTEPIVFNPCDLIVKTNTDGECIEIDLYKLIETLTVRYHPITHNKILYVYNYETTKYVEDQGTIDHEVNRCLTELGFKGHILGTIGTVKKMISTKNITVEYPFNKPFENKIPVKNGVLKLNRLNNKCLLGRDDMFVISEKYDISGVVKIPIIPEDLKQNVELLVHSPDHMFTFTLPIEYNPDANNTQIEKYLNSWVYSDDKDCLYQIPAIGFLQMIYDQVYKKGTLIYGKQNSGKSTYLDLNKMILGDGAYSQQHLGSLTENRFSLSALEGKIMNIADEEPDMPLNNCAIYKRITGTTRLDIEKKGQQGYTARIFAGHIYACNQPPELSEKVMFDNAWWERWDVFEFPNFFPTNPVEQDNIFSKENLSAFFNGVLIAMYKIRSTRKLVVNRSLEEVRNRWTELADPLIMFGNEVFVDMKTNALEHYDKDALFGYYTTWCEHNNVTISKRIGTKPRFGRDIEKIRLQPSNIKIPTDKKGVKEEIQTYAGYKKLNENTLTTYGLSPGYGKPKTKQSTIP